MDGPDFLNGRLQSLRDSGHFRELPGGRSGIDFWSNDYLGFSRLIGEPVAIPATTAPGSRLISGDHPTIHALENRIAAFHGFPSALLFGSGYTANLGLLGCLLRRGDTVIYDELCHASLRDGIRLSGAAARRCRHNSLEQYDKLISQSAGRGQCFVVTESRFSMDGDTAPLPELAELCVRNGAHLLVDEAHSIGIDGPRGTGLVAAYGLQDRVFACILTYGKAPGYHGAAILGSGLLRDYLVNFSRPFIFTTAPRPHHIAGLEQVYHLLEAEQARLSQSLNGVIDVYRELMRAHYSGLDTQTGPIQLIPIPGNEAVMQAEASLLQAGMLVKGVRAPSVPAGAERLRVCLHAFNTETEVRSLVTGLHSILAISPSWI